MEWNDTRIAELAKMWREGFSASQVARQLGGVSRSAVIGKVHRLGIAGRSGPSQPRSSVSRPEKLAPAASAGGVRRSVARPNGAAVAPPRAFDVSATATVLTLTDSSCRWPIGDPDKEGFGFCGHVRAGRGPYCEGHGPMGLRQRKSGMKVREMDSIVRRYVETSPQWASLEASSDAAQAASVAVAR